MGSLYSPHLKKKKIPPKQQQKNSKKSPTPRPILYNYYLSSLSPTCHSQCNTFCAYAAVHLMPDSKSSNHNCLSMGKINRATLSLLTLWDQRHSNVLPLHLIARATNQICLSVPNSPCKVHRHNKNFIKQLYFFHITNFKGNENLEEMCDIRKNTTPNKGYCGELGGSFAEVLTACSWIPLHSTENQASNF